MKWDSNNLKPGMRLGENIYSPSGNVLLLPKDKVLTSNDILNIKKNNIKVVNIEYSKELSSFEDTFNNYVHDAIMNNNIAELYTYADKASSLTKELVNLDIDLTNLDFSDKTDDIDKIVTRTNMALCMAKNYNDSVSNSEKIDIQELFLASTLQNIGAQLENPILFNKLSKNTSIKNLKSAIPGLPDDILEKFNPKYVEFYSARLLSSLGNKLSSVVRTAILFKDEKTNSTGPLKVNMSKYKNNKSYMISNIIKTCELFYNALEANYSYTGDPFEGIDDYINLSDDFKGVDNNAINLLKSSFSLYPLGAHVTLNNGIEAKVVKQSNSSITQPIVLTEDGFFVDLSKSNISILSPYKNNIDESVGYAM